MRPLREIVRKAVPSTSKPATSLCVLVRHWLPCKDQTIAFMLGKQSRL